jgi:SAM-dependent methyltransferase
MGASHIDGIIADQVNALNRDRRDLTLLEAGCGSASYFHFANVSRTVGIDTDPGQLEHNQALHEKILGDLQTYALHPNAFDIVVCWDVIEHLSRPRDALHNMFNCLKPGGVLVLGFPNLWSFKGLATKLTPYRCHELFYRCMKYRGRHFPTYLRVAVLPDRVIAYAQENGFQVIFKKLHEGGVTRRFKERFWPGRVLLSLSDLIVRLFSLGHCQSLYLDNCALILLKTVTGGQGPNQPAKID